MPRGRKPNTIEDFWRHVDVRGEDECWEWKKTKNNGYGRFRMNNKFWMTHRLALSTVQPVSDEMLVLHSCDNKACCNPSHLRVGTHLENMQDMVERKRQASGGRNGRAKLTQADVRVIKGSKVSNITLAEIFGVNRPTINKIKLGYLWGHVK